MEQHPLIAKAIEACGTQPKLADRVGCRQQTISKLLNREIAVSAEYAVLIENATAGAVTARDLRPDLPWPDLPWPDVPWPVPAADPAEAHEVETS